MNPFTNPITNPAPRTGTLTKFADPADRRLDVPVGAANASPVKDSVFPSVRSVLADLVPTFTGWTNLPPVAFKPVAMLTSGLSNDAAKPTPPGQEVPVNKPSAARIQQSLDLFTA